MNERHLLQCRVRNEYLALPKDAPWISASVLQSPTSIVSSGSFLSIATSETTTLGAGKTSGCSCGTRDVEWDYNKVGQGGWSLTSERKTAVGVGVLFIVATIAGLVQFAFRGALGSPDYLVEIAAGANSLVAAGVLDLLMIGAIFAIPVVIFPILERHSVGTARGYLSARIFEGCALLFGTISLLVLVSISKEYVALGAPQAVHYDTIGQLLLSTADWSLLAGGQVIFSFTAWILNLALYRSRLIPRIIAVWGLIGAPLALASGLLISFGVIVDSSTIQTALIAPIALQEMVFALWLIIRGFSVSTSTAP